MFLFSFLLVLLFPVNINDSNYVNLFLFNYEEYEEYNIFTLEMIDDEFEEEIDIKNNCSCLIDVKNEMS